MYLYVHREVNYLLNSYAADNVIVNVASEIELFMKFFSQMEVQFVKDLGDKALHCGNTSPEQRTKRIIVEDLPLKRRENMRTYWVARPKIKLRQFAQYTGTLMQLGSNNLSLTGSPLTCSGRRDCASKRKHSCGQRN